MDDYQKAIQKDLQAQYNRKIKREQMNTPTEGDLRQAPSDTPDSSIKVLCMQCGKEILPIEPGIEASVKDRERRFRFCRGCIKAVTGIDIATKTVSTGFLDAKTPGLERDRKLK